MPTYDVDVGGKTYEVDAPDERTAWKWANKAAKPARTPDALDNPNMAVEGMSGPAKFLAGVGKSISDTGMGLGQLVGLTSGEDVKETRARDKVLMDTGAGMAGNLVGTVGMTLAPGGALKAAGMGANALGAANAAQKLSAAGGAVLAPRSIGGALGVGAGMGAVQPAETLGERAFNTGLGSVASAVIPAGLRAASAAKSAAEPFYESGRQQILARALREATGGNEAAVMSRLQAASQPAVGPFRPGAEKTIAGEIVPGSIPTAAQVGDNAGLAALERAALATNPTVTNDLVARQTAQNAARIRAVDDIAGADGLRDFTRAELNSTADDLYGNAFAKGIDIKRDPNTGAFLSKAQQAARKGEITKLLNNPYIAEAVPEAKKLMQGQFKSVKDPLGSVEGLHYVKKALDDKIGLARGNEQRVLIGARDRLLTTIEALSPEYGAAKAVFADMAKPLSQMETAAEIAKRSVTPRGNMTLDKYARALSDDSAAKATGFRKATLEGTMSNEQMNVLNAVKDDLARADFAANAGRGSGSNTVQNLAYANILNQAGVPNFLRNFGPSQLAGNLLARGGDLAYQKANQRLSEQLARSLLDPAETAALMAKQPSERAALLAQMLSRGGASLGMMTPGLVDVKQ